MDFRQNYKNYSSEQQQKVESGLQEKGDATEKLARTNFLPEALIGFITMAAAAYGLGQVEKKRGNKLSRRSFLNIVLKTPLYAGILAGLRMPVNMASTYGAIYSTNPYIRELSEHVADITKPFFNESSWFIDGRTGLLIAKTLDTIDELSLEKDTVATILMGAGHIRNANEFISDENKRNFAIRDYYNHYWGALDAVFKDAQLDLKYREELQKKVKQLIATTDIVRLKSKQDNSEDDANIIKSFISKRVINNL